MQMDTEGFTQLAYTEPGKSDEKLYVQFSVQATHNELKSVEAGRPIFDDLEWIEIRFPGDRNTVIRRPMDAEDRRRFAGRYAAWKQDQAKDQLTGTPLSAVPWITRSQVEELAYFGVRSVEQLAGMADGVGQKFPGFHSLRKRAQDFLDAAAGEAPALRLRKELEERDAKLAALEAQIAELAAANTKKKG